MSQPLTLQQLTQFLWKAGDILHGEIDMAQYKNYIFRVAFLKHLSDLFDDAQASVIQYYVDKRRTECEARELADCEDEYQKAFYIPPQARWGAIQELKHDIAAELNKAHEMIEVHNPVLEGVLTSFYFNTRNGLAGQKLRDLLSFFNRFSLCNSSVEHTETAGAFFRKSDRDVCLLGW